MTRFEQNDAVKRISSAQRRGWLPTEWERKFLNSICLDVSLGNRLTPAQQEALATIDEAAQHMENVYDERTEGEAADPGSGDQQ